jgi:hypothetical protein
MADETPTTAREMLIVQSKVREEMKKKDVRVSEEFLTALNDEIYLLLDRAVARCAGNNRKTLAKQDV